LVRARFELIDMEKANFHREKVPVGRRPYRPTTTVPGDPGPVSDLALLRFAAETVQERSCRCAERHEIAAG
jgi:hypothetical protein